MKTVLVRSNYSRPRTLPLGRLLCAGLLLAPLTATAQEAFKIGKKSVTVGDLQKEQQGEFFEIEKQKSDLVERLAREYYLNHFWEERAKASGKSVAEEEKAYFDKNVKIGDKEVKETLNQFKEHPQLKKLPKEEQDKQIRAYLQEMKKRELVEGIINTAIKNKDLVITYPKPSEPKFNLTVKANEPVRYGPKPSDTQPSGCKGDECAITIIEYSEFQCPFCARVMPATKKILTDYKGKVRWITRDFPLSFHDRARPAAVAAHCAKEQGKFWEMYQTLFENQRALGDDDLKGYAKKIGVDVAKWESCVKKPPAAIEAAIDENMATGQKYGVTGTPAFFVNGRKLSGALPFEEFKRIIDEELQAKKG